MDWSSLLSNERLKHPTYEEQVNRSIFTQDFDRIVFSAPFRRLANKTQVQPLYENDHVHHRLIHSMEVSSVGRSLATAIGQWLVEEGHIQSGEEHNFANIVQAACIAHDIGNPPFGHSGEEAIGSWFTEQFSNPKGIFSDLDPSLRQEFQKFEGNAQGFRILSRTEMYRNDGGMRLSKAVLGAFMKYPVSAATKKLLEERGEAKYIGHSKFGIFNKELLLFEDIAGTLGLPTATCGEEKWWRRHPLVFVVEAADDICYNIVDLEDAFTTEELSFKVVLDTLTDLSGKPNRATDAMSKGEQIAMYRAMSIGAAIDSCLEAFKDNYKEIMNGSFSDSLIKSCQLREKFHEIKTLSREKVFTARRKTELEISGYQIIQNVLSGIAPIYDKLSSNNWKDDDLDSHSEQVIRALALDLRDIKSPEDALHNITDFVSGMTDRYALRISRMLSGT